MEEAVKKYQDLKDLAVQKAKARAAEEARDDKEQALGDAATAAHLSKELAVKRAEARVAEEARRANDQMLVFCVSKM